MKYIILACPASPIHYQYNPIKTVKTCTIGVINMLGLAKKITQKFYRQVQVKFMEIQILIPRTKMYNGNVNPIGPRSCYDEGKRCSETIFMDYNREHKLKIKIIRIFNTFGPNMAANDGRVISNFILQALNKKDLTINGDGTQTRSFQYIDDLIAAMIKMMDTSDDFLGPINIGNPNEISMNKLASTILSLTKSKSQISYKDLPKDDPKRRNPDINLAIEKLDWFPVISLETGLLKTINYFEKLDEKTIKGIILAGGKWF